MSSLPARALPRRALPQKGGPGLVMTSPPRTPLLSPTSPLVDSYNEGSLHKDMRQELQQLRHMIKVDMKELLDAEFSKMQGSFGRDTSFGPFRRLFTDASMSSIPMPFRKSKSAVSLPTSQPVFHASSPPDSPKAPLDNSGTAVRLTENSHEIASPSEVPPEPDSETRLIHNSSDEDSDGDGRTRRTRRAAKRLKSITNQIRLEKIKYRASEFAWLREFNHRSVAWCNFVDRLEWFWQLEEPKPDGPEGCLASFVGSKAFEGFFTFVILANSIFIAFQVNMSIEDPSNETPAELALIDQIFLVLYLVELVLKLCVHKQYFFWSPEMQWNILDFTLVSYSLMEAIIGAIEGDSANGGATWMRSLRFFRMAKVLRILRVVKAFKQLQIIVSSLLGSLASMVWSVIMLLILFYMFSLALCTQVRAYLMDGKEDHGEQILLYFGSVQVAIWTLFKATFGGEDWVVFYDVLAKLGLSARLVWYVFIVFTQVSILNILTGLYVESAMEYADGNAQDKAFKYEEQVKEDAVELRRMCEAEDWDKSNTLSKNEFVCMVKKERFNRYLRWIGLDTAHMHMFFDLISDSERGDEIDIPSFVAGVMQLRGGAKSSDLVALMLDVKRLKKMQDNSRREMLDRLGRLQESVERSRRHSFVAHE